MKLEEVEHVDECPICGVPFLGATPDDVREHMTEEHSPLHSLLRFPTREYKQHHEKQHGAGDSNDQDHLQCGEPGCERDGTVRTRWSEDAYSMVPRCPPHAGNLVRHHDAEVVRDE